DAKMDGARLLALRRKQLLRVDRPVLAIAARTHRLARANLYVGERARHGLVHAWDHLDAHSVALDPGLEGVGSHHVIKASAEVGLTNMISGRRRRRQMFSPVPDNSSHLRSVRSHRYCPDLRWRWTKGRNMRRQR